MEREAVRSQTWQYFLGLNAPFLSLTMIHLVNNPNIYHFVLTSFVEHNLLNDNRLNTALAGLSIISLLTAAVVQPAVGMLSDRTHSRFGPRIPYFIAGAVGSLVLLMVLVNAKSWLVLLPVVAGLAIALNAVQSPLQAMIPDYVAPVRMGLAASIKTALELSGAVVSGAVVVAFLGTNTRPELAVLVVSAILFASLLITYRAAPPHAERPVKRAVMARQRGAAIWLRITARAANRILHHPSLRWWLLGRFFFYASFNTIGRFAVTYMTDVLGFSGGEARETQGEILLIVGILIFVMTILSGPLSDRYGRRRLATAGALLAALASLALAVLPPNLNTAIVMITVMGIGSGVHFSAGWALVTQLVPLRRAAFYLGFMNLATTLGAAFGMLGGVLVDVVNETASDPVTGYAILFVLAAVFFGLGAFSTSRIDDPHYQSVIA